MFRVIDTPAYRDAIRESSGDARLADEIVPLSFTTVPELERIADEMRLKPSERFIELACGLGGAGLWVAAKTRAFLTGIDFSSEAIRQASARAEALGLHGRAQFAVADMAQTGLPDSAFHGLMSIDAIPFVDATTVTAEIARLLRPGGNAVLTAFEAEAPRRPTVVPDYRPYLEDAGLIVRAHEEIANWEARHYSFYAAILARADRLRAEMGEMADVLLEEAASPPPNRRVFIVATKP
ncbi:MAG: class I SAM-dependent methyltransferase [Candidatus Eremiobacteraeota bacterium]|nr:class I SAM-dependent methyltransferase [Candidatus Eremiobacteraeota bacterium]